MRLILTTAQASEINTPKVSLSRPPSQLAGHGPTHSSRGVSPRNPLTVLSPSLEETRPLPAPVFVRGL